MSPSLRRVLLRACALAAVVAAGPWLAAQQPSSPPSSAGPPPTFKSNVDVVRLDVSVLDKDRHPVRGLSAADFTLLEDGHERPIVAFTPVDLPAAAVYAPRTAAWVRDAPEDIATNAGSDAGRLVVLAFDWSIRAIDQALARRIAINAVDHLGPADQATVVFLRPNAAAGTPQDFTADRARLRATIGRPIAAADVDPRTPSDPLIDPERYQDGECLCGLCTLESLTQLADTLRTVSDRPKVVVLIATYVRTFEVMKPTHVPPLVAGVRPPTFTEIPGATDCPGRLLNARRAFERAAKAADVTVYALDPVGLETGGNSPLGTDRMRERQNSLAVIPDMTGGRTIINTNGPEAAVASMLDESGSYYLLGFTPGPGRRDGLRRITVRVRGKGLTVKARNVYTLAEEPASTAPAARLPGALGAVLPARDVAMDVSAVPLVAGRRGAVVTVARLRERGAGAITMLTAAFTPRARPVVSRRTTISAAEGNARGAGPLGIVSTLALAPGAYEIRVATELAGGAVGSVHTFVDVPDFARAPLSMSGILWHVSPEEPSAPRDEIEDGLPFAPTARRAFARTDHVSAFVQVSEGTSRKDALVPVRLTMRIVDAQDHVQRAQSSALDTAALRSNRTANSTFTIPTAGLVPGEYLMTLEAATGEKVVDRSGRFSID